MVTNTFAVIKNKFGENCGKIDRLMSLERDILQHFGDSLSSLKDKLEKVHGIRNPELLKKGAFQLIDDLLRGTETRPLYGIVYNQCVVLMVSYFAAAMNDVLSGVIQVGIRERTFTESEKGEKSNEFKMTLDDLSKLINTGENSVGEIIIRQRKISTQDMQSIDRTLRKYANIEMIKDENVNNIIWGQASRHVIVHNGEMTNEYFKKQTTDATPNELSGVVNDQGKISFSPAHLEILKKSMIVYLDQVIEKANAIKSDSK